MKKVENYERFLIEVLSILLKDIPLHIWQILWYQYNDCPSHSTCTIIVR